jgi:hypothetical protein
LSEQVFVERDGAVEVVDTLGYLDYFHLPSLP